MVDNETYHVDITHIARDLDLDILFLIIRYEMIQKILTEYYWLDIFKVNKKSNIQIIKIVIICINILH